MKFYSNVRFIYDIRYQWIYSRKIFNRKITNEMRRKNAFIDRKTDNIIIGKE